MTDNEYTPTTDQVRAAYVVLARALGAEFDRWLENHERVLRTERDEWRKAYGVMRTERDAALAVIQKAPHTADCFGWDSPPEGGLTMREERCTCWKSTVDTSALAARDAETRRQALNEYHERREAGQSHYAILRDMGALAEKGTDE